MWGLLALIAIMLALILVRPRDKAPTADETKREQQLDKLWDIAKDAMKERKMPRAEKALLTILRFDEKNASAYNRLGILYAKNKQYSEAIHCFEIAQSLDYNASTLHNIGLLYLETGDASKASIAFRQALELEGDVPTRYLALARAEEQLKNYKHAVTALEAAFTLDKQISTLRYMAKIQGEADDKEAVKKTEQRIKRLEEAALAAKPRKHAPKNLRRSPTQSTHPVRLIRPVRKTGQK